MSLKTTLVLTFLLFFILGFSVGCQHIVTYRKVKEKYCQDLVDYKVHQEQLKCQLDQKVIEKTNNNSDDL